MLNILADYEAGGALVILLVLASIYYAIIAFFVPFILKANMHNTRDIDATLRRIETLLMAQTARAKQQPAAAPMPAFSGDYERNVDEALKKLRQ